MGGFCHLIPWGLFKKFFSALPKVPLTVNPANRYILYNLSKKTKHLHPTSVERNISRGRFR